MIVSTKSVFSKNQSKTPSHPAKPELNSKSEHLNRDQNSVTRASTRKAMSPVGYYPRNLFQSNENNSNQSNNNGNQLTENGGDKLPDTLSISGSLCLENSASTTERAVL